LGKQHPAAALLATELHARRPRSWQNAPSASTTRNLRLAHYRLAAPPIRRADLAPNADLVQVNERGGRYTLKAAPSAEASIGVGTTSEP